MRIGAVPGGGWLDDQEWWTQSWSVPPGSYFVMTKIDYRLASSPNGAAYIFCMIYQGDDAASSIDNGDVLHGQDQYAPTGLVRGTTIDGTMNLKGVFSSFGSVDERLSVSCQATHASDGNVSVDWVDLFLIPTAGAIYLTELN